MAKKKRSRAASARARVERAAARPTPYIRSDLGRAPSKWYTDLSPRRRGEVVRYLREAVAGRVADARNTNAAREPGLRSIYPGFDASDGFDLRDVKSWTRAQHDRVQDTIKVVRQLLTSPYRVVTPRDAGQRRTLQHFTEQLGKRRRYVVHVQTPDARVHLVREAGRKLPTLQVRRPERFGGFGQMQFWMFRDYNEGRVPYVPREFVDATRRMLADMPDWGYFALWSRPNGVITIPQPKASLVRVMQRFFQEGESFGGNKFEDAQDILQGWVLQGNEDEAERVYIARQKRRAGKPNRISVRERQLRLKTARRPTYIFRDVTPAKKKRRVKKRVIKKRAIKKKVIRRRKRKTAARKK